MPWTNQDPPATNVLLQCRVTTTSGKTGNVEIDKLPDGRFRLTEGNLFRSSEVGTKYSLEALLILLREQCDAN